MALAVLVPSVAAAAGFVGAPGGPFLTDPQGRALQLHGVNLVAKCPSDSTPSTAPGTPCVPGPDTGAPGYVLTPDATDPGRRFTAADAQTLHRLGFTVVRLGMIWAGLEPGPPGVGPNDPRYCSEHLAGTPFLDPGVYSQTVLDAYLAKEDRIVNLLAAAGIRVILDMHQDAWGAAFANPRGATPWEGEGAPLWATCTGGLPFTSPAKWQSAYTDPAVEAAFDTFFANDVSGNLQGEFERMWRAVAAHYANNPNVVGYELFNEPTDATVPLPEFDEKLACLYAGETYAPTACAATTPPTQALANGLMPAIESVDPNHLVFYEAPVLTDYLQPDTVGVLDALPFPRLVLSFHVYGASGLATSSFSCTDPSCAATESGDLTGFSGYRAATRTNQPGGPAWFMSEFGAENYAPDVDRVASLADAHSVSWTEWAAFQLHDPTGSPTEAVLNETTRQPYPVLANVLARAYPLATAGTPGPSSFDSATGAFSYRYTPRPSIHAPTEIILPAWRYSRGYTTTVTGAHIISRPCATPLLLANDPGADAVTVSLRPSESCSTSRSPGPCPRPSGRLAGSRLGPVRLGMKRKRVRQVLPFSARRATRVMDYLCLSGAGIRVGYPSARLLHSLTPRERRRVRGRVILALTANRFYRLRGVRAGARLRTIARHLHVGRQVRVGLNTWYLCPDGDGRGVLKVRGGRIEELGIANRTLTKGRRAAVAFLHSFH